MNKYICVTTTINAAYALIPSNPRIRLVLTNILEHSIGLYLSNEYLDTVS